MDPVHSGSGCNHYRGVCSAVRYHGEPPHLDPCAFYSRKLSPVEQNYDIGNRELLISKFALEVWQHWLEGGPSTFTVITNHKKLQYLYSPKRLYSRQAHWTLFSQSSPSRDQYVKADSLSRIHSADIPSEPQPILPPAIIAIPIQWDLSEPYRACSAGRPRRENLCPIFSAANPSGLTT